MPGPLQYEGGEDLQERREGTFPAINIPDVVFKPDMTVWT